MKETYQTQCPACAAEGRDRSKDNLAVFPEGNTFCNACGYKGFIDEVEKEKDVSTDETWQRHITGLPVGANPERQIDDSVAEYYGVKKEYDLESGEFKAVYYPYYDDSVHICGYKKRDITVIKKRAFTVAGELKGLFGQQSAKGHGVLLIVEGEEDCLAAKQMLNTGIATECDVVSLASGAGLDKNTMDQLDFIKQYKKVFICMDADPAGKAAAAKIGSWLFSSIKILKTVHLEGDELKDASDYHLAGKAKEFKLAIRDAKEYEPEGMCNGSSIDLEALLEPEKEGYPLPFTGLTRALHGIRKAEILMICADSGIGKTTFSREITKSLIEQGCGTALIALEDQLEVSAKSLIALDMNIPLSRFRFAPPTKSECQPSFDKLIAGGKTFFYNHKGNVDNSTLLTTLTSYARTKTVDFIVLDHIGVALAGTENSRLSESKQIDILMNKLASLVTETGVGVIIVAHLKRQADGVVHPEGREVKLTDLRGSAALEQYSFAVVGLERDQQSEEEGGNNKVRVRLLKNRVFGTTGVVDRLQYDPSTGRLANLPPPTPVVLEPIEEMTA